jgi:hypothetical protein
MGELLVQEQRWTWEQPVVPRWLLAGGELDPFPDMLGLCLDIDGLFADPPPRSRERYAFVGCSAEGELAYLLDRLPAPLGNVLLTDGRPGLPTVLGDVVLLGHQPSSTGLGTIDIDLDGFVAFGDRTPMATRPAGFDLTGLGPTRFGTCRDVTGVYRERVEPPAPPIRLLGCRAEPELRQGRVRAEIVVVADDASAIRVPYGPEIDGTVVAVEPSALGDGLVDITIDSAPQEPLPTAFADVLDLWRAGGPTEKNLWSGLDRDLRHRWTMVAQAAQPYDVEPPRPTTGTYHLDGRFVTDIDGFCCALGEAINGPGGYFGHYGFHGWPGCNLGAIEECLREADPFTLVWHDSAVAGKHLVPGHDRFRGCPSIPMQELLDMFANNHTRVDLQ